MDATQFSERFRDVRPHSREFEGGHLNAIGRKVGKSASYYASALHAILQDSPDAQATTDLANTSLSNWITTSFTDDFTTVQEALGDSIEDNPETAPETPAARLIQEMNFHLLTFPMQLMWQYAAMREKAPDQVILNTQNHLSLRAITLLGLIHKVEEEEGTLLAKTNDSKKPLYKLHPMVGFIGGMVSEIDTAITALEVQKSHPSLHILTSPAEFEHGSNRINSDLIAIDTKSHQAIGIQVKNRVSPQDRQRYDSKFITLVGGDGDLGNVRSVRLPNSSSSLTISWPGLVSLHHLLGAPNPVLSQHGRKGKGFQPTVYDREVMRARLLARDLVRCSPRSNNERAVQNLSDRILPHLTPQTEG